MRVASIGSILHVINIFVFLDFLFFLKQLQSIVIVEHFQVFGIELVVGTIAPALFYIIRVHASLRVIGVFHLERSLIIIVIPILVHELRLVVVHHGYSLAFRRVIIKFSLVLVWQVFKQMRSPTAPLLIINFLLSSFIDLSLIKSNLASGSILLRQLKSPLLHQGVLELEFVDVLDVIHLVFDDIIVLSS